MTQKPQAAHLTDAAIYALPCQGDRYTVRDRQLRQLVLLVGQRSRTWYLHATVRRRTHRVRLGPFPVVATEQARADCLTALRRLYAGEVAPPRTRAPGTTLAQVLDEYVGMRRLSAKAEADLRSVIRVHARAWAAAPIASLDAASVARQYRQLADRHPAPANRLLAALSALTRFSVASRGEGDASLVPRVKALLGGAHAVKPREVVIPDALQRAWAASARAQPGSIGRYLLALMLTGMRAGELRCLPASGWDATRGALRLATSKNGRAHMLPVGPHLRAILEQEAESAGAGARLFQFSEAGGRDAAASVGQAIGAGFRLHDLRRTFATIAARVGLGEFTIKRMMNHSAGRDVTAKHYVMPSADDLRAGMVAVERHLMSLWEGGV